jgi:eukaryotic translation initiation factor 2-alpha kinase 4
LNEQIKADAERQQLAKEKQDRARKRAQSDATEMPPLGDTFTESFNQEISFNGVSFSTVKIFHPRTGTRSFSFALPVALTCK